MANILAIFFGIKTLKATIVWKKCQVMADMDPGHAVERSTSWCIAAVSGVLLELPRFSSHAKPDLKSENKTLQNLTFRVYVAEEGPKAVNLQIHREAT